MSTTLIGGGPAGEAWTQHKWWNLGPGQAWAMQRGKSQGDYTGCCSRSSRAGRPTCTRHIPIPVSHPPGREEPYPTVGRTGTSKSRRPGGQPPRDPAWQHVCFGSEYTAPILRQNAHSRAVDAPPRGLKGTLPGRDNRAIESPMEENRFTEFTSRGTVDRTKRPLCLQFRVLDPSIGPEGLAKRHTKLG